MRSIRVTITVFLVVLGVLVTTKRAEAAGDMKLHFDTVPNNQLNLRVGEKKIIKLIGESDYAYISAVDLTLSYGSSIKINSVTMNATNFSTVQRAKISGSQILLTGYNIGKTTSQLPKGVVEIATLEVEGVTVGQSNMNLVSNQIIGNDGSNIFYFTVNYLGLTVTVSAVVAATATPIPPTITPVRPTPTEVVENGVNGILKFLVTFAGVTPMSGCANDWPVQVVVRWGADENKVFDNVALTDYGEFDGRRVYKGEILLTGITEKNNLSVFIKGPKHVQVKYGMDGQNAFYNIPGGEISVETDPLTTTVYDFTGYPISAGDVNQDGTVDGLDFSEVKAAAKMMTKGSSLATDLNGNCEMESQDVALLMVTLKERMEQLY
jgi:hypothetical protein